MKKISLKELISDTTRDWAYEYEPNENWDGKDKEKEYYRPGIYIWMKEII